MASNDQIILDQVIEEERKSRAPSSTPSDFFEIYVAEQVLKDYDLSDDEIESGLVGSGGDGGIDGIYTFVNGDLVQEDYDFEPLKKNVLLEVCIIQSKRSATYDEDSMNKLAAVTSDLFNLGRPVSEFKSVYNEGVRSAVENFRRIYTGIAGRFPRLQFRYIYATRGDSKSVHPNVVRKTDYLSKVVVNLFSSAGFDFNFLGAADLLELARRQPINTFDIQVTESLSAKDGYIALVRLTDLYKFVSDEDGHLRKHLFESNVRDYQGNTQVNAEIQESLREPGKEDFWWLNNGVTIVATKAVQSGKVLNIEYPQIVNGQQTSTEIYNFFDEVKGTEADLRSVMVRVIVVNEPATLDRIIKATNSQTNIPPASLRATDKIHRDIEEYLAPFGIYYDRRKNYYKNLGRSVEQILSISLLAQGVMTIVLQRPNDARARPSSLLKKDDDYNTLFSTSYPIEIYRIAARLTKAVQSDLRHREILAPKDRTNILFYMAMYISACLAQKAKPTIKDIAAMEVEILPVELLDEAFWLVYEQFTKLGGTDQVAKGPKLLESLEKSLVAKFPQ